MDRNEDGIGEGGGEAKKREKPQRSCRRDVGNVGDLGGKRKKRQPQCRPAHRGQSAHTQRMMQLPEVYPRTVRPTERSPRAQNTDAQSRGTRDNAVPLRHVEPADVPLRHAAPSPPQFPESLHLLAKKRSRRLPDFPSGHAYQDGK